ncbi:hypothetical protein AKJ66_04670 [candidate division MSBL1 archaeon SCGC-AAA259E22]|uniref:Uncharacterized protein n=1 Tax=candidate division MSBL1 archaeon SCGC-AAA259E22 TaxID=1698265 RepID=A0A133UD56_9EURY|nr:hypothetical protein AKJ66_04670 [candidate division MSBL1 archaeon SCGC-AAA259E22]
MSLPKGDDHGWDGGERTEPGEVDHWSTKGWGKLKPPINGLGGAPINNGENPFIPSICIEVCWS